MTQSAVLDNESLILDLLEWVDAGPRTYEDAMAAWRTTCPRLTVWEDAIDASVLAIQGRSVVVTRQGRQLLRERRG